MSLTPKPKLKSHHRKRSAQHHRQGDHYMKTYWPYLPMLLIIGAGILVNGLLKPSSGVLAYQSNYTDSSLLSLTNSDRSINNVGALSLNSTLNSVATQKANEMADQNFWSHTSPSGQTPLDLLSASGYKFSVAGENLAYGFANASTVVQAWMNSPDHRANMLDSSYAQAGFGVAEAKNYLGRGPAVIVVAEYAEPSTATSGLITMAQPPSQQVSRLQTLNSDSSPWLIVIVSALAGAAMAIFITRHGLRLRRWALKGERYVIKHPLIDVTIVLICTICAILTRTSGVIG
jgi:hypothetical protein